jgi:hypothetical protein
MTKIVERKNNIRVAKLLAMAKPYISASERNFGLWGKSAG